MQYILELSDRAKEDLRDLPRDIQKRIGKKIDYFLASPSPLHFAEHLTDKTFGAYRFRVGNYRVRFDIEHAVAVTVLTVLTIRLRDEKTYRDN